MKNLIDQIKGLPVLEGLRKRQGGWISRDAVLELVRDYLAEYPLGVVELKGCTVEEIEGCLRKLRAEQKSSRLTNSRSLHFLAGDSK